MRNNTKTIGNTSSSPELIRSTPSSPELIRSTQRTLSGNPPLTPYNNEERIAALRKIQSAVLTRNSRVHENVDPNGNLYHTAQELRRAADLLGLSSWGEKR